MSKTNGKTRHATRESWLLEFVELWRPRVNATGLVLPEDIHVSVGWPGTGKAGKAIGECWMPEASADGRPQIFVSPVISDPLRVADIMIHELIHAAGIRGHGQDFRRPAEALGLTGRMTATTASDELVAQLKIAAEKLGPFPHAALDGGVRPKPKQSTRQLKVECERCGCIVRMTRKWLEEVGAPTCGCGGRMKEEDPDAD